ncbi:MAG: mechanosensitive ion channel family protein, partial [Lentisphaeria bacterium]
MKEKEQVSKQAGVKFKELIGMIAFFLFAGIPMAMAQEEAAADAGEAVAAAPNAFADVFSTVGADLPGIGGALVLLLVGFIIAKLVALGISKLLDGSKIGRSVSDWLGSTGLGGGSPAKSVSSTVFYLIMLVVALGVIGQLDGKNFVPEESLHKLWLALLKWWEPIICAAILVLVAWALATLSRLIVSEVLGFTNKKIDGAGGAADQAGTGSEPAPQPSTAGDALYYAVFLLFLPVILTTLNVGTSIEWVETLLTACTEHGPNILTAAVILWVGCLVAQVVRRLVTEVGSASGLDTLAGKLGIAKVLNDQKLSGLLGLLVY